MSITAAKTSVPSIQWLLEDALWGQEADVHMGNL